MPKFAIFDSRSLVFSDVMLSLDARFCAYATECCGSSGEASTRRSVRWLHLHLRKWVQNRAEIDFFGEISGISFSPDTEALFIGGYGTALMVASWSMIGAETTPTLIRFFSKSTVYTTLSEE
ncbi:unnamed protein product [Arabis nemorensis]|uniref:Uncharacterized protein n=1 Tax=Arabis nemorensis TaxID=586526 RepID=A0A565AS76_9BRAS|nr:unnamed protein product [Arabis nemorensis]